MLRSLILSLCLAPCSVLADGLPTAATHGELIDRSLERAETLGEDLKERITLMEREFNLPEGLAGKALESLKNGRVRELLNINTEDLPQLDTDEDRYAGGVFLFASFSIPDPSLKAMLQDAERYGVPVVFNGFVDNSVPATEVKVRALYEDESISNGFVIDPTLFARFNIKAVPTLVSTTVDLDVCETSGCAGDARPPHDRVAGNAPLASLLQIIAKGNAEHARPVQAILEAQQ